MILSTVCLDNQVLLDCTATMISYLGNKYLCIETDNNICWYCCNSSDRISSLDISMIDKHRDKWALGNALGLFFIRMLKHKSEELLVN